MNDVSEKLSLVKLWIDNNNLNMSDELNIIELLNQKYQFKSLAEYAKENNMTEQGVLKRKKNGKQPYIIFGKKTFYFE